MSHLAGKLLCFLVLASSIVSAAPARLAVVYGNNQGSAARQPLRYAEADAERVAQLLVELGNVAPDKVRLLKGRPLNELFDALDWARTQAAQDTVLFVYVSSHTGAEQGLMPGREALPWKELRARITATKAAVRITIVDGCQSSGLLDVGAHAAPTFELTAEPLTVKGDAFITSSASNEPSLEAGSFRGSVFTQHLLAGLRGAADRSKDRRVSLEEAYRYAYERTQAGASGQHPGFGLRLTGYGELVVTSLVRGVELPRGVDTVTVRTSAQEPFLVAHNPESELLALPFGSWSLEFARNDASREGTVTVEQGFVKPDEATFKARERPVQLVRLGAHRPCVAVEEVRVLPLTQALRRRLVVGEACQGLVTVRLTPQAGKVKLTTTVGGQPFERQVSPQDVDTVTAEFEAWLATQRN